MLQAFVLDLLGLNKIQQILLMMWSVGRMMPVVP